MASLQAIIGSEHEELLRKKGKKEEADSKYLEIHYSAASSEEPSLKCCSVISAFPLSSHIMVLKLPAYLLVSLTRQGVTCGQGPHAVAL